MITAMPWQQFEFPDKSTDFGSYKTDISKILNL